MIKKNYQINKTNIGIENFYLFYGVNEGSKSEKINELCKETDLENIFRYEEKNISTILLHFKCCIIRYFIEW